MILKFHNKYRTQSIRLATFDYSSNGAYFITICCKEMKHYFGHVCDGEMILNDHGKIADELWAMIPKQFPFIELGNFQIMPNHMHGILILNESVQTRFIASPTNMSNDEKPNIEPNHADPFSAKTDSDVASETRLIAPIHGKVVDDKPDVASENRLNAPIQAVPGGATGIHNPMLHENIGRVIRWYKGRCTFEIRKSLSEFTWLSSYWDHVIKSSKSYENIQNYIENNPKKWSEDRFYK